MANIKLFAISDFCPNGGWPKFDNLAVRVYSEVNSTEGIVYDVELFYECEVAGCCFISGTDNFTRLRKKIKINETLFEVLN